MALKLDNALLEELGLGQLPDSEKQLLLGQIYEKLEMNVGMRLADQMSNEQLDAFEKFVDANDDKGAFQWLESNFPNYKLVVNEEFEKLKAEIHSVAPQILASAQQQAQQQVAAGGQPAATEPLQPSTPQGPSPQYAQQYQQPPQYQQPQPQQAQPQQYAPAQPPAHLAATVTPPPHYDQPPAYPPQPPAPQNPTPQYQQQYQPSPTAMPQAGHLQPQYGQPSPAAQPDNSDQAQSGTQAQPQPIYPTPQYPPQYPPQQPPAGPAQ